MATLIVTNLNDSGAGSLRQAIIDANNDTNGASGDDTIRFHESLAGRTIQLNSTLSITSNINIDGDIVPPNGIIDDIADITIDGRGNQIFDMSGHYTVATLRSLTLTNGASSFGGAIEASDIDRLNIFDTTIQNSQGFSQGGAIWASDTSVRIYDSLLTNNDAATGGAIYARGGSVVIEQSTLYMNDATSGGGAAALVNSGLLLSQSTVVGNRAGLSSASVTTGGALSLTSSTVTINNSVVAENTSGSSAALNDVSGTINTANNSAFGTDVTITSGNNNIESVTDAGLGFLRPSGGTVWTLNITQSDSVLVNGGKNAFAYGSTDANGNTRISDGTVDIGATEFNGALVVTTANDVVDAGDGFLSLREAIAIANGNADADTISFASTLAGQTLMLSGGGLAITADVTIDGDVNGDNKADITISGYNTSSIFNMTGASTDVDLLSLTLTDGNSAFGGAVLANQIGTLDIQDTTIRDSAAVYGGGLHALGTDVTLTNSLVTGNTAGSFGGGIYVTSGSTLTVTNSTIHGNTTNADGGGICVFSSTITLLNSTVTGNQADADGSLTNYGGGIDDFSSTVTIINSVVAENTSGTALTASDVSGTVDTATNSAFGTAVTITTNTASQTGIADVGLGTLQDNGGTVLTRNIDSAASALVNAGNNGAAGLPATDANGNTRVSDGTVDIGATEFNGALIVTTANDVVDAGDGFLSLREAIAIANGNADADVISFASTLAGQTLTLSGSELAITTDVTIDGDTNGDTNGDNKADITISGNNLRRIFNIGGAADDVELLSLTLTGGYANGYGGAVFASGVASLTIADTTITNSAAPIGGGVYVGASGLTLVNSLLSGNYSILGGGLCALGASATLINTTVYGNSAASSGGGILASSSSLILQNSTVAGNHAQNGFGGVQNYASSVTVINSVLAGNTTDFGGTITSATNSFFGTTVTITTDNGGNINNGGDPLLGELLDNGGTVLTLSPLDGSPLIDAGSNAALPLDVLDADGDGNTAEVLPLDGRRGARLLGLSVDIGAVEQTVHELITGTSGANHIIGGTGNDILFGLGGDDVITGDGGADTIEGGAGADQLNGGGGLSDRLSYATSAGAVTVNLATNTASGGDATGDTILNFEHLTGSGRADSLTGNTGNNSLIGLGGADNISGGDGNDTILGGAGADTLNGGLGTDTLSYGGSTAVSVNIGTGAVANGHAAGDIISGFENVTGSGAGDFISGGFGTNVLDGGGGNDIIRGAAGADVMYGGAGIDTLSYAGSGAVNVNLGTGTASGGHATGDSFFGFERLLGSDNSDVLTGSASGNRITGGGGDDLIDGGLGQDLLTGDAGNDTFVLAPQAINRDKIADFTSGGDHLQISTAAFAGGLVAGQALGSKFLSNTTGLAESTEDRFIYDSDDGRLYYDSNGTATGGARLIATFSNLASLLGSDFIIV